MYLRETQLSVGFETGTISNGCFLKSTVTFNLHFLKWEGPLKAFEKIRIIARHEPNNKGEIFGGYLALLVYKSLLIERRREPRTEIILILSSFKFILSSLSFKCI